MGNVSSHMYWDAKVEEKESVPVQKEPNGTLWFTLGQVYYHKLWIDWLWIDSNISLSSYCHWLLKKFGREDLDNFTLNKMNNGKTMVMYMYASKFHETITLGTVFADVPWRGRGWMCAGDIRNWPKFTVTCCSGSQLLGNLRFINFIYSFLPWKTKIFESFRSLMHSDFTCIRPAFEVQKSKKQKQCFNNYYLAFI